MSYRQRAQKRNAHDRLTFVSVAVICFLLVIVARLFLLQVVNHDFYQALAQGQHALTEKLLPVRGEMFFRDATAPDELLPLVTNREKRLLYAVPKNIADPPSAAEKIGQILGVDPAEILPKLAKPNDGYEPIAHEVDVELVEKIEALRITGIESSIEMTRYYPFGEITGTITGFLGYKDDARIGQYGLEGYYEKELAGVAGNLEAESDAQGRRITVGRHTIREAKDGDSLLLTIDRTVQHTVCTKLKEAVAKHGARGGQVIIVQPKTGAILAMCSEPTYDPNAYDEVLDPSVYTNGAIFQEYEPGSVLKTMTLSAAMDLGAITPDTTYEDTGSVEIGKYTIKNADNKTYGIQTMNQVLEQSINTGAIFAVQQIGGDRFREYLERFGFGSRTDITLQGESDGDISALSKKGDIYPATASFGQGVSVTPLQLLLAYAAIVNNGKLMAPYIVESVVKPNGFHETTTPREVRQVIQPETAHLMKAMLVNVVRHGHGQRAGVPGYYIGGKTGTAQIPYGDRPGYHPDEHIGTFVGYGPMSDPAFVMLTKIDVPRDVRFAESSAAPLFGDIARFLLTYYRVPPDDTNPQNP
jgi:cell division protein FtsI/penicillin-binding protein 2